MNTILVAVDGSPHADKSLTIAASLAKQNDADIIVLYAADEKAVSRETREGIEVEYGNEITKRLKAVEVSVPIPDETQYARTVLSHNSEVLGIVNSLAGEIVLRKAVSKIREKGVESVRSVLVDGDPSDRIIEASEQHKVDTIVMGCRGTGKIKGFLLGSVSQSVAHRAECSVIIVK